MSMNIGLLGAGWFGREAHLRNLLNIADVQVIAASSRSADSRQLARDLAGPQLQVFENWQDVLRLSSVDAVIIALTNDQHLDVGLAAFRAGKHVLCEKPLALSVSGCDQLIQAAAESGRILQVGHEMRFQALYQRMHQLIRSGGIGDPRLMWCREYRGPMRPGWRSSESVTGGLLLEKNCHHFDLFHWMLDATPRRVAAFGGRDVLLDRELLDNAQVLVEFDGGRRAVLEICLFAPQGGDCEVGAAGTAGRIDTRNQAMQLIWHQYGTETCTEELMTAAEGESGFRDAAGRIDRGIRDQLLQFVECCRSGQTPLNNGAAARMNVAVSLAAQESIRRGEVVWIEEILQHGQRSSASTVP